MASVVWDTTQAIEWPVFQIYTRRDYGGEWQFQPTAGAWEIPRDEIEKAGKNQPLYMVDEITRALFPAIGRAVFHINFGRINDEIRGIDTRSEVGTGEIVLPDIKGHEVRIDARDNAGEWTTVFWGFILNVDDKISPATNSITNLNGVRTFQCVDLTYIWARKYLRETYFIENGLVVKGESNFHFNSYHGSAFPANRSSKQVPGTSVYVFEAPNVAAGDPDSTALWTDRQALELILHSIWREGEWQFQIDDPADMLGGVSTRELQYGSNAREAIESILSRSRGLGSAFLDWDYASGQTTIDADTVPLIRVYPQLAETVTHPAVDGLPEVTITGADSTNTLQLITITGDLRIESGSYSLGDADELLADSVTTMGEPLQVLVTLTYERESLRDGWTLTQETDFLAASTAEEAERLSHVYRAFTLPADWDFSSLTTGNAKRRCDYRFGSSGELLQNFNNSAAGAAAKTSASAVDFLGTSPCPDGVDPSLGIYGGTYQPQPGAKKTAEKFFVESGDAFKKWDSSVLRDYKIRIGRKRILITKSQDEGRNPTAKDNHPYVGFTVGLQMPYRVSITSGNPNPSREQIIQAPGHHVWLGHPGTVVGIDDDGNAVMILGTVYYRDDRDSLRRKHFRAVEWYTKPRRKLSYTLRACCGMVGSFTETGGNRENRDYPKLGHVIGTLEAGGTSYQINSVVSSIQYRNGSTTFLTDWVGM